MFTKPIIHIPLTSVEELKRFSYRTNSLGDKKSYCRKDGHIIYSDEYGYVFATPYRREIPDILNMAGYREDFLEEVTFFEGGEIPAGYKWLEQIAEEENWAKTYEMAFEIATQRGIKPVQIAQKCQVKQITYYLDEKSNTEYCEMIQRWVACESQENIASYIIIDEKTLMICDEYGRTFLISVETIINDIVNNLIEAGYKRTAHPERYIFSYPFAGSEGKGR